MADVKSRGRFVWYHLMTTDLEKAQAFYTKVVGWGTQVWPGPQPVHDVDGGRGAAWWHDEAAAGGEGATALARVHLDAGRRRDDKAGAVARCDRPGEADPDPQRAVPFPCSPIPRELRSRPLRRRVRRPSRKVLCRPASSPGTN